MKKHLPVFIIISFTVFVIGCGEGEKKTEKTEKGPEKTEEMAITAGYQAMTVTNGGTIKGTVTFAGAIPPKKKLEVTKDVNVCGKVEHYKQDLVVSSNKGLANVVISISNISQGKTIDSLGENFELDQNGCTFTPHVVLDFVFWSFNFCFGFRISNLIT